MKRLIGQCVDRFFSKRKPVSFSSRLMIDSKKDNKNKISKTYSRVLTLVVVSMSQSAFAQQLPSAGSQLQQLPPLRLAPRPAPVLQIEPPPIAPPVIEAGVTFAASALHVTGMSVFPESRLISVAGFVPGAVITLADLQRMAGRITAHYNENGYFVARAYLPPQTIADGVVNIAVIEGRYGKIRLNNKSSLRDGIANNRLSGLQSGDVIANAPLERGLLLLSDVPGVGVASTLVPGEDVGTSDLLVDVVPARRIFGNIEADNFGNRFTGYYRLGGSVNVSNLLGIGDLASVRGFVSDGGLTFVRGSYQVPIGLLTVGAAYTRLDYRLGREFAPLMAHGSADIVSVYASYPLLRSYDANVYLLANGDLKAFHDQVDATGSSSDRHSRVGTLGLSGDQHDSSGSTYWSIGWSIGNLDIRTPELRALDAVTAQTNGGFHRVNASIGRLQTISGPLSIFVAGRGQLASKNLDISEKMQLGGAYGVRAYPEGEAFGDQGYIVSAEARLALEALSRQVPGYVQLFAFIDHGGITFNRNRFSAAPNSVSLSAVGGGVSWADDNNFLVRLSYARRLGSAPVLSGPDTLGQFWVQVSKQF